MTTLSYTPYAFHEHLEMFEVEFRHSDLPLSFARILVPFAKDESGNCIDGSVLDEYILAKAPPREWFDAQELRLSGATQAIETLPAAFRALAPVQPPARQPEWYEDISVGEPTLIDGRWVRPVSFIDLRSDENLLLLKVRRIENIAAARFRHETGGIDINGSLVKTDRESQATISGAYTRASTDPTTTVEWKADNGFVTLNADAILFFGGAVFSHVQGCFARERVLGEQVEAAADVEALMAIDIETGWSE